MASFFFKHSFSKAIRFKIHPRWPTRSSVCTSLRQIHALGDIKPAGQFVDVDGYRIHYEKMGRGDHVVFFLPGGLGTTRNDFGPQLDSLDRDKFTLLAWDAPGYGFSRPPDRTFPLRFLQRDAEVAKHFIDKLGISSLSLVGWCAGGSTAIVLAAHNPGLVRKLVVIAPTLHITLDDLPGLYEMRDISNMNSYYLELLTSTYGREYFQSTWVGLYDAILDTYRHLDGDACLTEARLLRCPVLAVRGKKDVMVGERNFRLLVKAAQDVKTLEIDDAKHDVHLSHPDVFNRALEEFLLS